MSRTYHHGYKQHARHSPHKRFYEWDDNEIPHLPNWLWMTTPSWWIKEFMTSPQRAEVRHLTHKVMKLTMEELEDPPLFPLAKKPHQYFW